LSTDGVTYTVKELLAKLEDALVQGFQSIDQRLLNIDHKLDQKADNARAARIEESIAALEQRIEKRLKPLEDAAVGRAAVTRLQGRLGNALVLLATSAVGAFVYLVVTGGHP
jgi:hypothetical protein